MLNEKTIFQMLEMDPQKKRMSKGHRRIAEFIVAHYDRASVLTASALGEAVGVSESTVVRFAMSLGFNGFPAMQAALREQTRSILTNKQRAQMAEGSTEQETIHNVMKADMQNLKRAFEQIDIDEIGRLLDCMEKSRRIFICAHRSSSVLAQFMEYYLSYIFNDIKLISSGIQDSYDVLAHAGEEDIFIAISFPRYSSRTLEAARIVRAKGTPVCAITDSVSAPIAQNATYRLVADCSVSSFADSMVAPMALLNAIIAACGKRRQAELEKNLSELEEIWKEHSVYTVNEGNQLK